MKAIFADTYCYLALLNGADEDHLRCRQFTESFSGIMYTTDWILTELADAFSPARSRQRVVAFIEDARIDPDVTIIVADHISFSRGWKLYSARPDKDWSLTDCISFEAMRMIGITDALTADHHFEQAGFRALLR